MLRGKRVVCFAILMLSSLPAQADLYTGGVPSLDWLVDSSDEIVIVQSERQVADRLQATIRETLRQRVTVKELVKATADEEQALFRIEENDDGVDELRFRMRRTNYWLAPGRKSHLPSEWLLFLRTDGKNWHIFRKVNLTWTRELSSTAAIIPSGEALKTKAEILEATKARLKLARKLPPGCNRELIEGNHRDLGDWFTKARQSEPYMTREQAATLRGGFVIRIDNEYWDNPNAGDVDEDLWLTHAFVPADPQYAKQVVERVTKEKHPSDESMFALLNYPGQKAENALEKVIESGSSSGLTANRILYYLRYRFSPEHRLDEKLFGKWLILGRNETVQLELRKDHTCVVNTRPTKFTAHLPHYRPVKGHGYWAIHDGKLWFGRSHAQRPAGHWSPARREFFAPKKMLQIEEDTIKLEGGPPMKREPAEPKE